MKEQMTKEIFKKLADMVQRGEYKPTESEVERYVKLIFN